MGKGIINRSSTMLRTPRIMKFRSLSMLVLLNFVFPEFCISFVSFPAKITTPYAHSVFRSTVPVGDINWLQRLYVGKKGNVNIIKAVINSFKSSIRVPLSRMHSLSRG